MKALKGNPRKSLIILSYFVLFVISIFSPSFGGTVFWLAFLGLNLVYVTAFRVDCAAIVGNINYVRGKPEKAEKFYLYCIPRETKSAAAHLYYGIYLIRTGRAAEAEKILDKSIWLKPKILDMKNIQLTRASCKWVLGDADAAIEILEGMRATYDYVNAQVLSTLGFMYFVKDDLEKAIEFSQAAIDDTPGAYAAWDNLGQIYYKQKDLPKAKEAFNTALSYKEKFAESLYYLGMIAKDENETEKAREYLEKALSCEITPFNTVTREMIERALRN